MQLAGERVALRRIGIRLVLQFPHLLGLVADFLGRGLLLARKTLDPAHHLVALRVEGRIQSRRTASSPFPVFPRWFRPHSRRSVSAPPRSGCGERPDARPIPPPSGRQLFACRWLDRGTGPDARDRNPRHLQLLAGPVGITRVQRETPAASSTDPSQPQRNKKDYASKGPRRASLGLAPAFVCRGPADTHRRTGCLCRAGGRTCPKYIRYRGACRKLNPDKLARPAQAGVGEWSSTMRDGIPRARL